ncbi:thioredoxin [Sulfurimonas sp. SAG-AH-194-L11]|nr:thioredoxin [Sulfurimonas sp. SAG-AH-194-L11]MDF1876752.1 thioredoxin [Sulfurimonas sp. SAG-AH-194-L11]
MSYIDLTTKNFTQTLEKSDIIIIDFWAEWCGPCKQFAPIFEKVAQKNPDITFGKLNTEEQKAIASQYDVFSIPTLVVIRDGIVLLNQAGMLPEETFDKLITHVKDLDMDQVRKELDDEDEE